MQSQPDSAQTNAEENAKKYKSSELTQKREELGKIEQQITSLKREADETLKRFYSEGAPDPGQMWKMRMKLAEISLKNVQAIADYVRKTSPPAANDLDQRRRAAVEKLQAVERSHDLGKLTKWYKEELGPLLNKAEQGGYLVATTIRRVLGDESTHFRWQLQQPAGMEEHIKLYGKPPDQFKYLNQTCPICGGRIDEKGWCGCGNIGGG